MKRILVTGGAGYVGAILVPKLLRAGYNVTVLDLFLYADESIFPAEPSLHLVRGDLRDLPLLEKVVPDHDVIIHLAGISNDPSSDLSPELTREVNIRATTSLIDIARECGVGRFINASSSSVYGIKVEADVTEDLPLDPLTIYSESKRVIEEYLDEHRGPMTAVSVRSATVCGYSPRMRLDLTVNILTHHALRRGQITVFGGVQKRPNIHIDDITAFYLLLIEAPASVIDGEKFNVCGENQTVMELAKMVQDTIAPDVPIRIVPTDDLRSYHISAQRVKDRLGFSPRRSIADAVKDVAAALSQNLIANPEDDRHYNVRVMKKVLQP